MPVSATPWLSFNPCSTFSGQNIDTQLVHQQKMPLCAAILRHYFILSVSHHRPLILYLNQIIPHLMLRHLLSRTSSSTFISHVVISNILPHSTAASHSDINHAFAIQPSAAPTAKLTEMPALQSPIRVTPKLKPKGSKQAKNVFHDDRGFPNQSHEFDTILHNINSGCILCKRKHPAPPLDTINPNFHDKALHGAKLREELDLSHLDPYLQATVYGLIQKYCAVPIRHYIGKTGYHIYGWSARRCRTHIGYAKLVEHQTGILSDYYFSISTRYRTS